jgi:putative transposase
MILQSEWQLKKHVMLFGQQKENRLIEHEKVLNNLVSFRQQQYQRKVFTREFQVKVCFTMNLYRITLVIQGSFAVPHRVQQQRADNQRRVVALDPGIRTFISFFSTECAGKLGEGDFSQIMRLCQHLDNLNSRRAKTKKKSLTKAHRRAVGRIRYKIDELHHKVAKFLVDNFDVILLPTFETKQMTKKISRKIGSKSVRAMLGFAHFRFKQFLKFKAENAGKMVVDCSEAYTSKTHPQTGKIRNIGSAKTIRLTDGSLADRDLIGARNILFRALVDSPVIC